MPQANPELRKFAWNAFGNWNDSGPVKFLETAGYRLTKDWLWIRPTAVHLPSEAEMKCILFLIEEWDYGGLKDDMVPDRSDASGSIAAVSVPSGTIPNVPRARVAAGILSLHNINHHMRRYVTIRKKGKTIGFVPYWQTGPDLPDTLTFTIWDSPESIAINDNGLKLPETLTVSLGPFLFDMSESRDRGIFFELSINSDNIPIETWRQVKQFFEVKNE